MSENTPLRDGKVQSFMGLDVASTDDCSELFMVTPRGGGKCWAWQWLSSDHVLERRKRAASMQKFIEEVRGLCELYLRPEHVLPPRVVFPLDRGIVEKALMTLADTTLSQSEMDAAKAALAKLEEIPE